MVLSCLVLLVQNVTCGFRLNRLKQCYAILIHYCDTKMPSSPHRFHTGWSQLRFTVIFAPTRVYLEMTEPFWPYPVSPRNLETAMSSQKHSSELSCNCLGKKWTINNTLFITGSLIKREKVCLLLPSCFSASSAAKTMKKNARGQGF